MIVSPHDASFAVTSAFAPTTNIPLEMKMNPLRTDEMTGGLKLFVTEAAFDGAGQETFPSRCERALHLHLCHHLASSSLLNSNGLPAHIQNQFLKQPLEFQMWI